MAGLGRLPKSGFDFGTPIDAIAEAEAGLRKSMLS
jgi:hypothetical protein